MNLEDYAQLSFSESESYYHWTMKPTTKEPYHHHTIKNDQLYQSDMRNHYHEKLSASYSTPTTSYKEYVHDEEELLDVHEKNQFLREIHQVRQDIIRFREEMNGLAKQMNGMETDLNHSKDRVREIENGLTATQEVNVNLQVLLEKAVHRQRESDVYANQAMRHIHTNLATVVYETGQLRGRLTSIANYQKQHQGSVCDVAERIREYTDMLEQAQGTIQSLQDPNNRIRLLLSAEDEEMLNSLDVRHYSTDEDDEEEEHEKAPPRSPSNVELYRHRIIKKRASNPEMATPIMSTTLNKQPQSWLPQKGLRILLDDYRRI